jgi:transcriptional regulator with XRE-family HTH domain
MSAAEKLRSHRLKRGLTQEAVAALAGVPRERISEWERGVVEPGYRNVERILTALGYDLTTVEGGDPR